MIRDPGGRMCHHGRVPVIGRLTRAAAVLVAAAALGACSGDDAAPPPTGNVQVATVRGALLQAADVGPTWKVPEQPPPAEQLQSFCGGDTPGPPVPAGATVVAAPIVDEGDKGAQTLYQTGLVYPDASAAAAGLKVLRAAAEACAPSVSMPARTTAERNEPAYTETVERRPFGEGGWTGIVVIRHKAYDPAHPSTADTAVSVLARGNVVLVNQYAVYRLGATSASPQFEGDWKRLLGTVLNRLTV